MFCDYLSFIFFVKVAGSGHVTAPAATLASGRCEAAILGLDAAARIGCMNWLVCFGMVADIPREGRKAYRVGE